MNPLPSIADQIARLHAGWTALWHEGSTQPQTGDPWTAVEQNHRMNFELWHEEDMARRDDLGSERVHQAKRAIDRCNQSRNDAVERLDAWFLSQLPPMAPAASLHSETPGMIIDRLSILSLKVYHIASKPRATPPPMSTAANAPGNAPCSTNSSTI